MEPLLWLTRVTVVLSVIRGIQSIDCPSSCAKCVSIYTCTKCKDGFYGESCSKNCSTNCDQNKCLQSDGQCITCKVGYYFSSTKVCAKCPEQCDLCVSEKDCTSCKVGFRGKYCQEECTHCKPGTGCSKEYGVCFLGCIDGYSGMNCTLKCSPKCKSCKRTEPDMCELCDNGRYGVNCEHTCSVHCVERDCNKSSGYCIHGCNYGYWGKTCEEPCPKNCLHGKCYRNGVCSEGCSDNFTRSRCVCPGNCECDDSGACKTCTDGFDYTCDERCGNGCINNVCIRNTSECYFGCKEGYSGKNCNLDKLQGIKPTEPTGHNAAKIVVPIVVIAVLVAVGIVVAVVRRNRIREMCVKRRQTDKEKMPEEDSPMLSAESADPRTTGKTTEDQNCVAKSQTLNDESSKLKTPTLSVRYRETSVPTEIVASQCEVPESEKVISALSQPQISSPKASHPEAIGSDNVSECDVPEREGVESEPSKHFLSNASSHDSKALGSKEGQVKEREQYHESRQQSNDEIEDLSQAFGAKVKVEDTSTSAAGHENYLSNEQRIKEEFRVLSNVEADVTCKHAPVQSQDGQRSCLNACYIDGYYNKKKAYIVCSGPTVDSCEDFWKMIWEEECEIIVNLTEPNGDACCKYWPAERGESVQHGDFNVICRKVDSLRDFQCRQFSIKMLDEDIPERKVIQLHFMAWSENEVPRSLTTLMKFYEKMNSLRDQWMLRVTASKTKVSTPTTVVHCNDGMGRSGTFIAIDLLIQELKSKGCFDVSKCVQTLRSQRTYTAELQQQGRKMIDTLEQYTFVYKALNYYYEKKIKKNGNTLLRGYTVV